MKRGRRPLPPPWRRPSRILWFVLAVIGACWLTLHMPESHMMRPKPEQNGTSAPTSRMHRPAPVSEAMDADVGEDAVTSSGPTKMDTAAPRMKRHAPLTPAEKIFAKMKTFGRLFAIVGIAAFLGGLMEARRWHMALARVMGKLARMARLPEIVGLAMPTALCSNAAANSILVSSHADGHIRTSALIAGGMANSYLAYVSHSIRVMYPVIGAIGLPGALYFAAQFSGGFIVILGVLLWNRWYVSGHGDTPVSGIPPATEAPLGWPSAVEKAAVRSLTLLFRMVCITVPLMLCIEWLLKNGAFNFWEQYVPDQVNRFFPAELVSVVAAQMGGLVQSSAVAANLKAEGLIDNAQILLAMLVGSAVGNPFRTLRRNLPSALGIFPVPVAFAIVIGMQLSRFVVTLVAIAGVIAMQPRCIVLDEPTAMLDPIGRADVVRTIKQLNRERGVTVVLITHHMDEAAQADRLVVMAKGKVVADGSPKQVFSDVEGLRSVGLTVPYTTQLLWELRQAGYDVPLDALSDEECAAALFDLLKQHQQAG